MIDLEGTGLDPGAVADAIEHVQRLVGSLVGVDDVQLTLTDLRGGSAHISLAVVGSPVDDISCGIDELRNGPALPRRWTRKTLSAVAHLSRLNERRGVESVRLQIGDVIAEIDAVLGGNAEKALSPVSSSLGSMRGVLFRYSNDPRGSRRSAGLRRSDTGDSVDLRFSISDAAVVRECLEREVEVWGEITRDVTGGVHHLTVEGIESVSPPVGEMCVADGYGLLGKDWTAGTDPVDWVRMMRD